MTTNSPFPWLATADPTPPHPAAAWSPPAGVTADQLGRADGWPTRGSAARVGATRPGGATGRGRRHGERARCRRAYNQRRMAPAERGAHAPPRRRPRRAGRSRRHPQSRRQAEIRVRPTTWPVPEDQRAAPPAEPWPPRAPVDEPPRDASGLGGPTGARPSSAQPPGSGRVRQPHRRPVADPQARGHDRAPSPTGATAPRGRRRRPRRIPGHGRGRPRGFRGRRLQRTRARGPDGAGTRRRQPSARPPPSRSPPGSPRTSSAGTRTHPRSVPRRCARTPATPTTAGTPPPRAGTAAVANVSTSSFRRRRYCAWRPASSWCH